MNEYRLKLNMGKTEFILFGSQCQLLKCQSTELNACRTMISKNLIVSYLGVWTDELLNLKHRVKVKCKSAVWNLKRIQIIRNMLDQNDCVVLSCSIWTMQMAFYIV